MLVPMFCLLDVGNYASDMQKSLGTYA